MRFWNLPGPANFLDRVTCSLEEGLNIAIAAPMAAAGDFAGALLDRLRNRVVDVVQVENGGSALSQVTQALRIGDTVLNIDELYSQVRFCSSDLIFVCGITIENWPDWRQFFDEYDDMSKDRSPDQRPKLIAVVHGMDLPKEVTQGITFRCFRWMGSVSALDMTLYVFERIAFPAISEGGRLLAASVIANIALGDVDLADALAVQSIDDIWRPQQFLKGWSARYGWTESTVKHWTAGTVFRVHGREELHSAMVAINNDSSIIQTRIWAAQAAILLPSIERERIRLVGTARPFLRPPFLMADGEKVMDAGLLEIGPLAHQMYLKGAPREMRKRAVDLKELRNKLAHMEILNVEESLNTGLL